MPLAMAARSFVLAARDIPADRTALRIERTADHLASVVELALNSTTRRRGLLGRASLPEGHALLIAPSGGVHTFGMAFPIDIVFTDRRGAVLKIRHAVPARRIAVCLRGHAVVELPAGTAASRDLQVGDTLRLESRQT